MTESDQSRAPRPRRRLMREWSALVEKRQDTVKYLIDVMAESVERTFHTHGQRQPFHVECASVLHALRQVRDSTATDGTTEAVLRRINASGVIDGLSITRRGEVRRRYHDMLQAERAFTRSVANLVAIVPPDHEIEGPVFRQLRTALNDPTHSTTALELAALAQSAFGAMQYHWRVLAELESAAPSSQPFDVVEASETNAAMLQLGIDSVSAPGEIALDLEDEVRILWELRRTEPAILTAVRQTDGFSPDTLPQVRIAAVRLEIAGIADERQRAFAERMVEPLMRQHERELDPAFDPATNGPLRVDIITDNSGGQEGTVAFVSVTPVVIETLFAHGFHADAEALGMFLRRIATPDDLWIANQLYTLRPGDPVATAIGEFWRDGQLHIRRERSVAANSGANDGELWQKTIANRTGPDRTSNRAADQADTLRTLVRGYTAALRNARHLQGESKVAVRKGLQAVVERLKDDPPLVRPDLFESVGTAIVRLEFSVDAIVEEFAQSQEQLAGIESEAEQRRSALIFTSDAREHLATQDMVATIIELNDTLASDSVARARLQMLSKQLLAEGLLHIEASAPLATAFGDIHDRDVTHYERLQLRAEDLQSMLSVLNYLRSTESAEIGPVGRDVLLVAVQAMIDVFQRDEDQGPLIPRSERLNPIDQRLQQLGRDIGETQQHRWRANVMAIATAVERVSGVSADMAAILGNELGRTGLIERISERVQSLEAPDERLHEALQSLIAVNAPAVMSGVRSLRPLGPDVLEATTALAVGPPSSSKALTRAVAIGLARRQVVEAAFGAIGVPPDLDAWSMALHGLEREAALEVVAGVPGIRTDTAARWVRSIGREAERFAGVLFTPSVPLDGADTYHTSVLENVIAGRDRHAAIGAGDIKAVPFVPEWRALLSLPAPDTALERVERDAPEAQHQIDELAIRVVEGPNSNSPDLDEFLSARGTAPDGSTYTVAQVLRRCEDEFAQGEQRDELVDGVLERVTGERVSNKGNGAERATAEHVVVIDRATIDKISKGTETHVRAVVGDPDERARALRSVGATERQRRQAMVDALTGRRLPLVVVPSGEGELHSLALTRSAETVVEQERAAAQLEPDFAERIGTAVGLDVNDHRVAALAADRAVHNGVLANRVERTNATTNTSATLARIRSAINGATTPRTKSAERVFNEHFAGAVIPPVVEPVERAARRRGPVPEVTSAGDRNRSGRNLDADSPAAAPTERPDVGDPAQRFDVEDGSRPAHPITIERDAPRLDNARRDERDERQEPEGPGASRA